MPRARVRKVERKRKRSEVKIEPLADGAGGSSAAGAGRAGARGGGGSDSGSVASHCESPPAKRARVTMKKERKVKVEKENGKRAGKGKVEGNGEEREDGEEELAFDLAPPRRRGGETEEPLGPPRYGKATRNWDGVSRWMSFSSCRAFARSLGLKSRREWMAWSKVPGQRPEDVPCAPNEVYAGYGWQGWGDFLGTGNYRKDAFKSFDDARAFTRGLKLSGHKEWRAWSRDHRPSDIPSAPDSYYKEAGWTNWGDFLSTVRSKRIFKSFDDARAFARGLKLSSVKEWNAWRKNHRPSDIPSRPDDFYKEAGWTNWGDFLGTGNKRKGW